MYPQMYGQPLDGYQGEAGMASSSNFLGLGSLPPPLMSPYHTGLASNHTDLANLTLILTTLSNMTAWQVVEAAQTFLLTNLVHQYMTNFYFSGVLGLGLLGFLGTQLTKLWAMVLELITRRKGSVQIRVPYDSEVFPWLHDWLQQFTIFSCSDFDVSCTWESGENQDNADGSSVDRPKVRLFPEFKSAQKITYKNETVWIQTSKQFKPGGGGGGGDGQDDFMNLLRAQQKDDLLLSCSSKPLLESLLKEVVESHFKEQESSKSTNVYRWSCEEYYWVSIASRKARPVSTVILENDPAFFLEDAKRFLNSADWYAERGIPHRRGYLLYGPPGCGKTSLIKAMAGELNLDVSLISLSAKDLSDDMLQNAMTKLPHRSIFVLEDVDAAFGKKEASSDESDGNATGSARSGNMGNNLSFSGLLNAIDGITAQEGRIVVMTTNHIDKLDNALIRPGRIDLRLHLGLASTKQACGIFRRFYPDATVEQEAQVSAAVPSGLLSPASLQGLFLEHRDDVGPMLERLPSFVADAQPRGKNKGESKGLEDSDAAKLPSSEGEELANLEGKPGTTKRKEKRNKKSKERRREVAADCEEADTDVQ